MIKIFELEKMRESDRERVLRRSRTDISKIKKKVEGIVNDVKRNGDRALLKYTKKFDGVKLGKDQIRVSKREIGEAHKNLDKKVLAAIKKQISLAKKFHRAQLPKRQWSMSIIPGVQAGQKMTPIESVGLYVPGGRAPYPTVMQILAVPAKIAGVEKIVACSPPRENMDAVIVAGQLAGVNEIYRVGGVQAIAAMAFGTESVPKVNKIVGPGNVFVTAAKQLVFGEVDIDMPAGPSEAIILADERANPKFCAADILARAEHDANAAGVMVTNSMGIAKKTRLEIERQKGKLSRKKTIEKSLAKYSAIIVTRNIREAVAFANEYAPEHMEVMVKNPKRLLPKIRNAGSIFLGDYAPVAVGDYASGVNHILPTGGYAKMFSPVNVGTFMKKSEFEFLSKKGLGKLKGIVDVVAGIEGFDAHAKSVDIRFEEE